MRSSMILPVLLAIGCAAPSEDDAAQTSSAEEVSTHGSKVTTQDRATGPRQPSGGCAAAPDADFAITYVNESLPWGSRVVLHSGYGFYEGPPYDWLDVRDDEAKAVAPFTWKAPRHVDWHAAAAPPLRLDFAIEIHLPDGRTIWDTNGRANYYYMAEWSGLCDGAWHDSPMFNPVP